MESPKRRGEMTLATTQQAVSVLFNMLVRRGYLRPLKYGDVLVFSVSTSILFYFYQHEPQYLGNVRGIFNYLIGKTDYLDTKLSQSITNITGKPVGTTGTVALHTVVGFLKSFSVGFLLKTCFRLIAGPKISRKFLRDLIELKHNRFPLFLGFLTALTRLLSSEISGKERPIVSLIVGFIAGLSILFSRNIEVSMWALSKAGEVVLRAAIAKGIIKPPKNGQILLYSTSCAVMFYSVVWETDCIRKSAWKFLNNATGDLLKHFPKLSEKLRGDIGLPEFPQKHKY
jgi:hypothetical protein